MCLHAVAAENFQLVRNNFAHRNGRSTLLRQHQTDLNVLAALAQIADGIETGCGVPESIQGNVSAALRDLDDCFGDIGDLRCIHSGNRAQSARQTERFIRNIYCYDVGADRVGNHNRRQAHPAAAVDCHPLSGGGFALIYDRAKGSYKPTAETGSRGEIKRLRQSHKIRVGVMSSVRRLGTLLVLGPCLDQGLWASDGRVAAP